MSSLQRELNRFYAKILDKDYSIQEVTKGALSQARAKLKPEAFLELNAEGCRSFYEDAPYLIWKDHRVLAADGSSLLLPDHATTREEFGVHQMGRNADAERCMATTSIVYDVLNLLTLDAIIDKYAVSEQVLLKQHLSQVKFMEGDLLLLDRGYPSMSLLFMLQQRRIGFCMRLKGEWWLEAQKMLLNGQRDKVVTFRLPNKDIHLQKEYLVAEPTITCRLVVIELENGEREVLCTSLMDKKKYTYACLKELYHLRWNVEEAYKLYKCRARWDVFSGKTARNIKQDFYAKVFMMTMCAILSYPIEEKVRMESETSKNQHPRKINRTNALALCREIWARIWIRPKIQKALAAMDDILKRTCEIIRTGRKFRRKHLPKKPPSMEYKQL
jgi:Transposase DDE domain